MRVVTPQLKLSVRFDDAVVEDGKLIMTGVAGMLPCEATLSAGEIRNLIKLVPKIALLRELIRRSPKVEPKNSGGGD